MAIHPLFYEFDLYYELYDLVCFPGIFAEVRSNHNTGC